MAHPIVVVATDDLERSITIAINDGSRIEYFIGDRYTTLKGRLTGWVRDEWYNYAIAQLTKHAIQIEMCRPSPLEREPTPQGYRQCLDPGSFWEIGRSKYGSSNFQCPFEALHVQQQEEDVSNTDFQNIPSRQYSWTVIASRAQSFQYHQERRWYKTAADAKENAAIVIGNSNHDVELCIVQCYDMFKKKPRVDLVSTFNKTKSRR